MKQHQWKIHRGSIEGKDAQDRWDQAYQSLLSNIKQTEPEQTMAQHSLPAGGNQLSQLRQKQEVLK